MALEKYLKILLCKLRLESLEFGICRANGKLSLEEMGREKEPSENSKDEEMACRPAKLRSPKGQS